LTVTKPMSRRYSKIRLSDLTAVSPETGAALKRELPSILAANYAKAANAARRRFARLSELAENATSPKQKEKYTMQALEAAKIMEEMDRRSNGIE
jgi:hypothetical protein